MALRQVPGQHLVGVAFQGLGNALVGGFQIPPGLPFANSPAFFPHKLTDITKLGTGKNELRHLVNAPVSGGTVNSGHG